MTVDEVMAELEKLGTERTKKIYVGNGAKEPLFGVATGAMKPMKKIIGKNQSLAEELYATGNYDAMYFAGVIADPKAMTEEDFDRWINDAYFFMISDYIVAVTLSESPLGEAVSKKWIASGEELKMSAGWSCYCWMLGNRKDDTFSEETIAELLDQASSSIHTAPPRTQSAMSNFISTVGVSFKPLHEKAMEVAKEVGVVVMTRENKPNAELRPLETIDKAIEKGRIGFKRRYVRC
ncbi:DNA alkylation repair protein [Paenisporosarcina cavernae]|uniref:DNA alkylation repair protein n=1 Tax=Paenisporosarcina cavernae TaxID=2320858 RepID=A0A385YPE8_9BACL|nr:DNA alkylation repair protein [Paenisporosarcina cavernae]AYC28466.1 DNA alkylation repair protein [Paenisporosarcina cavernae]